MFIHISRGWSFLHLQTHNHIWWPLPEKHTKMQRNLLEPETPKPETPWKWHRHLNCIQPKRTHYLNNFFNKTLFWTKWGSFFRKFFKSKSICGTCCTNNGIDKIIGNAKDINPGTENGIFYACLSHWVASVVALNQPSRNVFQ